MLPDTKFIKRKKYKPLTNVFRLIKNVLIIRGILNLAKKKNEVQLLLSFKMSGIK